MVGDLVSCKENDTEKVPGHVTSECEDQNCNDADDSTSLDEISGAESPEERSKLVKV